MQEINHPIMCIGHYQQSNRNIWYQRQILNHNWRIHGLGMPCHHLQRQAMEGHRSSDIQEALQLY